MRLSIRTVLAAASVLQVGLLTAIVITLAVRGGSEAVQSIVDHLLHEIHARVSAQVRSYVTDAYRVNQMNADAVRNGFLSLQQDPESRNAWRPHLRRQAVAFPSIGYFTIGDVEGNWAGLKTDNGLAWAQTDDGHLHTYTLSGELVREPAPHDPWSKHWYATAARDLRKGWSPIYIWETEGVLSMTLSEPVRDPTGVPGGIVAVDLTLGSIHRYLQSVEVGETGRAFLMERTGDIVAASQGALPFQPGAHELKPARMVAVDYPDPLVARTARLLADHDLPTLSEARFRFQTDAGTEAVEVRPFTDDYGLDWLLVVVVSESDFMGGIYGAAQRTLLFCAGVLVLSVLFTAFYARRISRPLAALSEQVGRIQDLQLDNDFASDSRLEEVAQLSDALGRMQAGLSSFRRFVPADLVRSILSEGAEASLGGEMRDVTILFSDLRGYSGLVEHREPTEVIGFMNRYFQAMQDVISAHQGVILELQGDAILAVFGAPYTLEGHTEKAARCALAMVDALESLESDVDLGQRVGIHTGRVLAGNIGGTEYMKYGVIGDSVNVAARLERMNKDFDTSVLVSLDVYEALPADLQSLATDRGSAPIKGRQQVERIFSLQSSGS